MSKSIFCIFCGQKTKPSGTKCLTCNRDLEEVIGLAALLEDSTLIYREVVEKKGQIKVKETWLANESQSDTQQYSRKDFSTFKFMFLIAGLMAAIWIGADYIQGKSESNTQIKKEIKKEKSEPKSELYRYGYNFVEDLSSWQLNELFIYRWLSPGDSKLSKSSAEDWCSQLPKIVVGLTNRVGFPANRDFVEGCADAVIKIRF
jgi:predicted DNA-binding transcriptional regulator